MIKKMLTRGTVMVVSLIAAQKVIAKLEKESLKRDEDKSKKKNSKKDGKNKTERRLKCQTNLWKQLAFQTLEMY
jgi:hypothetical protein